MTENHEFNAGTVEEAVAKASEKLGVAEDELTYEVLDDGSPGFLGIGARDARISVTSAELSERNPEPAETPQIEEEEIGEEPVHEENGLSVAASEDTLPAEEQGSFEPKAPEDLLSEIEEFAAQAVRGMGFDARIDVYDAGEFIAVDVSPEDTGLFIGQKGETIDAFQHLLNATTYRNREFVKRIILDSEGYRQRRIEAVQGMAHRMARKAAREGRTIELPPMNAAERRIVHVYLKENPKVSTASDGTGESRRVNISPVR